MKTSVLKLISLAGALILTFLFYRKDLGLNLFIAEVLFIIYSFIVKKIDLKNKLSVFSTISLFLSAVSIIVTHSDLAFAMNFLSIILFMGVHVYTDAKSLVTSISLGFSTFLASQAEFFKKSSKDNSLSSIKSVIKRFRLYIIPILFILVFTIFYRNSNPIFDEFIIEFNKLLPSLEWLRNLNFNLIITFSLCLIISNFLFLPVLNKFIKTQDQNSTENLVRKRTIGLKKHKANGLTNQLKSAIFLFLGLNFFLLILNITDIYLVWFNFSWKNGTLKEFVHEGTFYLLISIILSVLLVLHYFKGNLNFYSKNRFLKILCSIWLVQNIVLTFSVGIRNFWYIHYFSLAHLRIGLALFIIMTVAGLITVFIKVRETKSLFYLVKVNSAVVFSIMLLASLVDWDIVISTYNTSKKEKSYYHLDYMSTLSDKTLPIVDLTEEDLALVKTIRSSRFSFERGGINSNQYLKKIKKRKLNFINEWEGKHFLEWNLPDQLAYYKLTDMK